MLKFRPQRLSLGAEHKNLKSRRIQAASECLSYVQDPEKQKEVGELFGGEVSSDEFFKLVTIGKMITDFQSPDEPQEGDVLAGDTLDEEAGVAVEFEGEDADEDGEEGDEIMVCFPCSTYKLKLLWHTQLVLVGSHFPVLFGGQPKLDIGPLEEGGQGTDSLMKGTVQGVHSSESVKTQA